MNQDYSAEFVMTLIGLLLVVTVLAWASLHDLGQYIDAVGHGMERMMPDTVPSSPPTTPGLIGCDCRRVP